VTFTTLLPPLIVATSLVTGIAIFFLDQKQYAARAALNLIGAGLKVVLVAILTYGVLNGVEYEARFHVVLGFDFLLRVDLLSLLLIVLSTVLWFVTTVYAIGYMHDQAELSRFFGFFSMCVTASVGVALAGNLVTFFIFYEFLTLSTYPLVIHKGDEPALRAGRTYLWYTLTGGAVLFVGVAWMTDLTGPVDFTPGGVMEGFLDTDRVAVYVIFAILILSLGVKAAIVPLHGWLPIAMVAPAPVSALLHAVAVVKAGAFGIVRVIYDVYGIEFSHALGLLLPVAIIAAVTIIYGSLRALQQSDLKKRLAYSTVSQVSYIVLGAGVIGFISTTGSLVHLIHQGIMKITLFFCAGIIEKTFGFKKIADMRGIGSQAPLTAAAFTVAAFGMIGVPPVAGFVSKWYLGLGGLEAGMNWIPAVLILSSLLNAAYFLPIVYTFWFGARNEPATLLTRRSRLETMPTMLWTTVATAVFSLGAGVFAFWDYSPLALAREIAELLYVMR
jgi:multicomponent Na+:H+ antiporter subunit D